MKVGFTISKIVIIQSLESHEVRTGEILCEYLASLIDKLCLEIQVELLECHSAYEFKSILLRLIETAASDGERPLLHVECHGSQTVGLEFENGSELSWDELGVLLSQLNIASRFNLFVVVAACYGAYLNGQFSPVRPSPAFCIVAPTEEIDPSDVLRGFREFYSSLFRTGDAGIAANEIVKIQLGSGQWFSQLAEEWFIHLIENYVTTHLTHEAFEAWVRSIEQKIRDDSKIINLDWVKSSLLLQNREGLTGKYFDSFFCINEVPEGRDRFVATRARVNATIDVLRATGRYIV